jgi:hypothetical protein
VQITAIESPADADANLPGRVLVVPGSQVTVDFTCDIDTPGESLHATLSLPNLGLEVDRLIVPGPADLGTHLSEQISFTIPTSSKPGSDTVSLVLEDGSGEASAYGGEIKVYIPLSNLQITAIHSPADTDGALDQHVTVVPGSQVTVDYTFDGATPEALLFVHLSVDGFDSFISSIQISWQDQSPGLHHSAQISFTIPTSTNPGSGDVQLMIDSYPASHVEAFRFFAITVPSTIVDTSLQVEAPDATYDGQHHGATAIVNPGAALGTISYHYTSSGGYDSDAAPINAGTYHVVATFTPDNPAAFSPSSGSTDFTISKATLTGNATTQDVLNMAKQGNLTITISNVAGLVNGDTLAAVLSSGHYFITVTDGWGTREYEFLPTTVTTSGSSITITYSLKDSALATALAAELADNTSAATAVRAGFRLESQNYTLNDAYLTRLFSTTK